MRVAWTLALAFPLGWAGSGCRSSSGGDEGEAESEAEAEAESEAEAEAEAEGEGTSIYDIQSDTTGKFVDQNVTLSNVVVTAVDTLGEGNRRGSIFVQEPEPREGSFRYGGIFVFGPTREDFENGDILDLRPGDVVHVTGTVEEFALDSDRSGRTTTEITMAFVERVGTTDPPEPVELTLADLATAEDPAMDPAEAWEGVLVRLPAMRALCGPDQFGFRAAGADGQFAVDIELYLPEDVGYGTCYASITGPLHYFFYYRIQPRGPDDLPAGGDGDCPALPEPRPIADIQNGRVEEETDVAVRGTVIGVAEDDGVYIQDGEAAGSGIFAFSRDTDGLAVGDEVVAAGRYVEFFQLTELENASVCRLGKGTLPAPRALAIGADDLEDWEGMLVEVADVTVATLDEEHWTFGVAGDAVWVDDDIFHYEEMPRAGDRFSLVRGPLTFSFDHYRILPRSADELVAAP